MTLAIVWVSVKRTDEAEKKNENKKDSKDISALISTDISLIMM